MIVKLADKQVLTGPGASQSDIYTDPVELGKFNRGTAILVGQYGHGAFTFNYEIELSNNLESWVVQGPSDNFSGPGVPPVPLMSAGTLNARYMRAHLWALAPFDRFDVCVDLKIELNVESLL